MTTTTPALEITTPSDRELTMTRVFNAPRELVFDAYTKPELVKRWLGAFAGWTFDVCEIDLRVGGSYRYVWRNATRGGENIAEGCAPVQEMGMRGIYREVVRPERLVVTEQFDEPWYPGDAIVTTTFTEKDGRTTMATTVLYDSKETRDGVLASPMESGVSASYDMLEKVLEEQR